MKKNTFLCVDLKVESPGKMIKEGEIRKGNLKYVDKDHFLFREHIADHKEHPELHWRLLDRTKHGRIHLNSRHVKVEFYIRHDDYRNSNDLADILAREVETMGESLCDICLSEEVDKCC